MSDTTTTETDAIMPGWYAADGSGYAVYFPLAKSGKEAAQEYVDGATYDVENETSWIHLHAWQLDEDGERVNVEPHRITLEPAEPPCVDGEHDWDSPQAIVGGIPEAPGVYGNDGGVTIQEVCMTCGCGRLKNTWARDPETGEQGLKSVRFEPRKYAREIQALQEEATQQ